MEQMSVTSTFGGRKIRIEGQDSVTEEKFISDMNVEKDGITLGKAASMGLLKTGMIVLFKDSVSSEINLDREMAGIEQTITTRLFNGGIVFQKGNEEYAILALLCVDEKLAFKGRFARANAKETVKYIVNKAVKNNYASVFRNEDLMELCKKNYLVTSYLSQYSSFEIILDDETFGDIRYVKDLSFRSHSFYAQGDAKSFRVIAICIDDQNIKCQIQKNSEVQKTELNTYMNNPHSNRLEIGGILE